MITLACAMLFCFVLPRPLAAVMALFALCASGSPRVVLFGGVAVLAVLSPAVFFGLAYLLLVLKYHWDAFQVVCSVPPASPVSLSPLRLRGGVHSGSDRGALAASGDSDTSSQSDDDSNAGEEFVEVDVCHYLRVPLEESEDDYGDDDDEEEDDSGMEADDEDDDDDADDDEVGAARPSVPAVAAPPIGSQEATEAAASSLPPAGGLDDLGLSLLDALPSSLLPASASADDEDDDDDDDDSDAGVAPPPVLAPVDAPATGSVTTSSVPPVVSGGAPVVSGSGDQSAGVPVPPLPGDGAVFAAAVLEQSVPAAPVGLVAPAVEADAPAVPHALEDIGLDNDVGAADAVGGAADAVGHAAGNFDDGAGAGVVAGAGAGTAAAGVPSVVEEEWEPIPMDIDSDGEEGNRVHGDQEEVWDPMDIEEDATMTLRRGGCRRRNAVLNHGRRRRIMALPLGVPAYRFAGPYTIPWYKRSLSPGQRRRNIQTGALMVL